MATPTLARRPIASGRSTHGAEIGSTVIPRYGPEPCVRSISNRAASASAFG